MYKRREDIVGEYECLKCHQYYTHFIRQTECPRCGHLWVKWLNYEELNASIFHN